MRPGEFRNAQSYHYGNNRVGYNNTNNTPRVVGTTQNSDGSTIKYYSDGYYEVSKFDETGNGYFRSYNSNAQLCKERTCENGKTIVKDYAQDGRVTCLYTEEENEAGETVLNTCTGYTYDDNGNIIREEFHDLLSDEKTTVRYDENGNRTEKFVQQGTVTTYYGADDNPIRRETNKCSGIIETEDLTE